jgi:hypothetical protein
VPLTVGNKVILLKNGAQTYNAMLAAIKPFVSKGVLTRVPGSRGGKLAYCLMVDRGGSKLSLVERGVLRS